MDRPVSVALLGGAPAQRGILLVGVDAEDAADVL